MKFFGMGFNISEIHEVIMFFMPGCITHFGKHIPETILLLEKIDIQRAEIKAKIA